MRRSQGSSVRIIIRLRNEPSWNQGSIPGNGRNVTLLHSVQVGSGEKPTSLAMGLKYNMFYLSFQAKRIPPSERKVSVCGPQ
jgi:hypothetical protein